MLFLAGAPIRDIDSMIGICINTVARRVVFDPESPIIDTLRDIQADQIHINNHEYITLPEIQSQGILISALFRTLLNIRNLPGEQLYPSGKNLPERLLKPRAGGIDG